MIAYSNIDNLMNVSMTLPITENQSVIVTFEKIENDTLFYTMQIADIQVHLTTEPKIKPTEDKMSDIDYTSEDRAVDTFYKLLMVDDLVQLSKIYYLVECETGQEIAPYGFCSCGFYRIPVWDERPDLAQFCLCEKYSD